MTKDQKVAKPGLLELAKQRGNVSQACKILGYSRDSFYRFNLKSAVEALAFFDLRAEVASTWREAGRGAQEVAVEEGLKRAR